MAKSDTNLLRRAVDGDQEALTILLKQHGPDVRRRLAPRISACWRSVISADDVMQVSYLEAFLGIAQRQPETLEAFENWLARIAENNLRDVIRELEAARRPNPKRRISPPTGDDSLMDLYEMVGGTHSTPSRAAARNEAKDILNEALQQIPETYRRVVQLYDLDGRSVEEIAESLGRSTGAIYMLRARALERLRGLLGGGPRILSSSA